jgi:NADH dehydrogenase (ubiquinone) 1 alpha subcomplex subunit 2
VRDFISKHYVPLKEQNPSFPLLVRECSGIQPRLWARYAFGQEKSQDLSNFNADQVLQAVYSMAKS